MAFDAAGNLYATAFEANNVYKFDTTGNLLGTFGGPYNSDPESIVFDKQGNAYVGQADGTRQVRRIDSLGHITTYSPLREDRGTDWIDLAADQCTLFYTSEGQWIHRFNVCNNMQLPAPETFNKVVLPGDHAYALRIRPNGEVLVANTTVVVRLDSSGNQIQQYRPLGSTFLFALNLDPDNKSFWTADYNSGAVYRLDIDTGVPITTFHAGVRETLAGLAVVGEITAATHGPPPATTTFYIKTTRSTVLTAAGRQVALDQIAAGGPQHGVVALLFGAPRRLATGQYGANMWGHPSSVDSIGDYVQDFIIGYYNALGSHADLRARVVITTSNDNSFGDVTTAHAREWASLITRVSQWVIDQHYVAQVDVAGGTDIEEDFADPDISKAWVDAYASTAPGRFLYNLGAASGCPPPPVALQTATASPCYTKHQRKWNQDDVWYVSWGADPAIPIPEIYNGTTAQQWAQISLYAYLSSTSPQPPRHNGGAVVIAGTLTQDGACAQVPSDPSCPTNAPPDGWRQLDKELNADARTKQTLAWSTDIRNLRCIDDLQAVPCVSCPCRTK